MKINRSNLERLLGNSCRRDVAEKLGCSLRTLDRAIQEHQLTRPGYGRGKLSDGDVDQIRTRCSSEPQAVLAKEFGVSQALISKIVNSEVHRPTIDFQVGGQAEYRCDFGNQR